MPSSPLPSLPLRQTVLVKRIREAEQHGHWQDSELLRSQLVHRYGIAALAGVDQKPAMLSVDPLPPVEVEPAPVEPVAASSSSADPTVEQPTGLLERVNAKLLRSTRRPLREASTATTPPLSTPRSLRRWLPGTDGDVDRQAS